MRGSGSLKLIEKGMQIASMANKLQSEYAQTSFSSLVEEINLIAIRIPSRLAEGCKSSNDTAYRESLKDAMGSLTNIESKLDNIPLNEQLINQVEGIVKEEYQLLEASINSLKSNVLDRPKKKPRLTAKDRSREAVKLTFKSAYQPSLFD